MGDALTLIDHAGDRRPSKQAEIVRLPARGGIERSLVEVNRTTIRAQAGNLSPEFAHVGVAIVKAGGHSIAMFTTLLDTAPVVSIIPMLLPLGAPAGTWTFT